MERGILSRTSGEAARMLLWAAVVCLSTLPHIQTANELMTNIALRTGAYSLIERFIVPSMTRVVASILLNVFGVKTSFSGGSLFVFTETLPYELNLSWNCVGWQSLVLLAFTLVTILQGSHSRGSKLKCAVIGLQGVLVVNLLRIVTSALLLLKMGYGPAIAFHDNLSLVLTLAWLMAFWIIANTFILEPKRAPKKSLVEWLRGLRLSSVLPDFIFGKRGISVSMMAMVLVMTALGGVTILSVRAEGGGEQTILSFEGLDTPVTVNSVSTTRILTLPAYTDLDISARVDTYSGGFWPGWVDMWDFYLYGPLEEGYSIQGSLRYVVWLHLDSFPSGKTQYKTYVNFTIFDVDEYGASTEVNTDVFSITLKGNAKKFTFTGSSISEYSFDAGHTIRLRISIYDGYCLDYILEYDSESRHSYMDLPGMVVPERLTWLLLPLTFIHPFFVGRRRRNNGYPKRESSKADE